MVRLIISRGLAVGVMIFLVGSAFHVLVPIVAPGIPPQFGNPALFRPWNGWTATYMAFHPFVYGIVFASGYLSLRRWLGYPLGIRAGLVYGAGVFLIGSLPIFLLHFASTTISPEVMISWIVLNMVQYLLAGIFLGLCLDDPVPEPPAPLKPLPKLEFVELPNVEWIEHPFVVMNSRVLLYHPFYFGTGKGGHERLNSDPEYLYSDHYLVVENSEADLWRHWVSPESWGIVSAMIGRPAGYVFTVKSMKGPHQYKVLAIHIPRDGRTFRKADLE